MVVESKAAAESARPLAGKRIMVTRARSQAGGLADKLKALGAEVVEFPTIEIRPPENYAALDAAIENVRNYDWVIFTSVNGVEQFLGRAQHLNQPVRDSQTGRFAAIGPATAKRLEAAGIHNCLVPQKYQAEGLLDMLAAEGMGKKKVLIPRAAKAREILPETLRQWGAEVDLVEAYRTVAPSGDASRLKALLRDGKLDLITFTSSSTVANCAGLFDGQNLAQTLAGVTVACIGQITQKTVEEFGGHADIIASESTIDGLIRAIVQYFAR